MLDVLLPAIGADLKQFVAAGPVLPKAATSGSRQKGHRRSALDELPGVEPSPLAPGSKHRETIADSALTQGQPNTAVSYHMLGKPRPTRQTPPPGQRGVPALAHRKAGDRSTRKHRQCKTTLRSFGRTAIPAATVAAMDPEPVLHYTLRRNRQRGPGGPARLERAVGLYKVSLTN